MSNFKSGLLETLSSIHNQSTSKSQTKEENLVIQKSHEATSSLMSPSHQTFMCPQIPIIKTLHRKIFNPDNHLNR